MRCDYIRLSTVATGKIRAVIDVTQWKFIIPRRFSRISNLPANHNYTCRFNVRYCGISIYTDGACYNNGKLNACCGSGIWFTPNDPHNNAIRVPGPHQSNQVGEIVAIIEAISAIPPSHPLTIFSDSKYAIEGLTEHLRSWEDIGWIGIKNMTLFKRAAYLLKKWTATR